VFGALAALLGTYGDVIALKIEELRYVSDKVQTGDYIPAYGLIWVAFHISYHRLGLLLLAPALVLLWLWRRRLSRGSADVLIGWIGVVVVFLAVEMASALQVRYIYFITPLVCVLAGLLLATLAGKGQIGRWIGWAIVGLLLVQGAVAWHIAAFEDIMMSMSPLLR
jgi:hypothetical protein